MASNTVLNLPSQDEIINIYSGCMDIRAASKEFLNRTNNLTLKGINVLVIAQRSEETSRIFQVAVDEINSITTEIYGVLSKLEESGSSLAENAIANISKNQICDKYLAGYEKGIDGENGTLLLDIRNNVGVQIRKKLNDIASQLDFQKSSLKELEKLAIHIPFVTNIIKINASEFSEVEEQFKRMAQQMDSYTDFLTKKVKSLTTDILGIISRIHAAMKQEALHD